MVATNDEFPIKKHTSPTGVSGIDISGGVYNEDYLQKLIGTNWAKEADKMRTQDGQVKMILNSIKNPILSANWDFIAADATDEQYVLHRDFVEFVLTCDMLRSWDTFVNEALSFIAFGHSVFEIIHKNVANHPRFGNYTGIKSLSFRAPKTLEEWQLDRATGELQGILQRSSGDFTNDVVIPSDFLQVFTIDLEGNYFQSAARSWLRPVYGNYLMKQFLRKLKGIGHEKMTVGTPAGEIPSEASEEDERKFENMLKRFTSNEYQYLKIPEGYKVNILKGEFNAQGLEIAIDAENREMVRAFLANFLNLGQATGTSSGGGGSYALGADLSDFFLKGIQYVANIICSGMNRRIIPNIIDLNFGEQEAYPTLVCSGVQDVGKEMSEIISNYVTAGAVQVDDTLRKFLRKLHKLPPEDEPEEGTEPDPSSTDGGDNDVVAPTTAEPSSVEPNPTTNEPDVSTDTQVTDDVIPAMELQATGRKIITKSAEGLEEVMALNLDFIANKLQADIVNRFKNLPEGRKRASTVRIKPGGVNRYKKDLRAVLTNIAAIGLNEAQIEAGIKVQKFATKTPEENLRIAIDIASGKAKARFPKLPRGAKDKILVMAEDLANAHATDLEKAAKFAANNSIETTDDAEIIAQDIKEATNKKSKQLLSSAPISSASEMVNAVRLETFLSREAKAAGNVGFQFFNPAPVSKICQNLAGRIFSVDNKDARRHFPPLHFNCKSILIPIKEGTPKAARINDDLGLQIVADTGEEVTAIAKSIQFSDSQILQKLADVQLTLSFQTLLFDREFYSRGQASQWAAMRGFSTVDTEELEKKIAIRQRHPEEFKEGTLTKIHITQGVDAIAGDLLADFSEPPREFSDSDIVALQESTTLQTLVFDNRDWTRERAVEWARNHDFRSDKVDETSTSFRLRQRDPDDFQEGSFRTINITTGLKAVIGRLKDGG